MNQFNIHKKLTSNLPPPANLPILARFVTVYKQWQEYLQHFPKKSRFTLGKKVDELFIEILELIFIAGYLPKEQKLPYLKKAVGRFDLLKFFIQISWETKILDNNKYIAISALLDEIGKMLGGWFRQLIKQTSAPQKHGVEE